MTDLFAARSQMATSLGFHIIFAAVGVALPLLMVIAESLWLKTKDQTYRILAQQWAKGTASRTLGNACIACAVAHNARALAELPQLAITGPDFLHGT
ncbi:MAG: cytochrome ubiquinol oxidase subunit I, partial [Gammaproteobacteria bacterium]